MMSAQPIAAQHIIKCHGDDNFALSPHEDLCLFEGGVSLFYRFVVPKLFFGAAQ